MNVKRLGVTALFTHRLEAMRAFYEALGITLEREQHDPSEAVHYTCELGSVHFAIFEGPAGDAPTPRAGGADLIGFAVASLEPSLDALAKLGSKIVSGPEERPWGRRVVVLDPDGRSVELFESG